MKRMLALLRQNPVTPEECLRIAVVWGCALTLILGGAVQQAA